MPNGQASKPLRPGFLIEVPTAVDDDTTIGDSKGCITCTDIEIIIDDLGGGNPPENASIKGIAIVSVAQPEVTFKRADVDTGGGVNITDGIFLPNSLFGGQQLPACRDSADANDDGGLNIADAVYIFNMLFGGGALPPDPGMTTCGVDPTDDALDCAAYNNC